MPCVRMYVSLSLSLSVCVCVVGYCVFYLRFFARDSATWSKFCFQNAFGVAQIRRQSRPMRRAVWNDIVCTAGATAAFAGPPAPVLGADATAAASVSASAEFEAKLAVTCQCQCQGQFQCPAPLKRLVTRKRQRTRQN